MLVQAVKVDVEPPPRLFVQKGNGDLDYRSATACNR